MLKIYGLRFPQERERVACFERFVNRFEGVQLYDRKNFVGHLTVGGFVVSGESGRILLLRHNQLGKWLQPGGHVDPEDRDVTAAVYREILEETGIAAESLRPLKFQDEGRLCPVDIDCHPIGRCEAKSEEAHRHFDLRFAFLYRGDDDRVVIDRRESGGFRWVEMQEFASEEEFGRAASRIAGLLDSGSSRHGG